MHQVHGSTLARIESLPAEVPEADGLVTLTPGLALAVLTADCVPILLVAPRAGAVAAVHAGWRGTVARIAQVAVEKLCRWSGEPPSAIEAALGPSIGACCYQVGVEVAEAFGAWRKPPASLRRESEQVEKWRIDLRQANVEALREAGLSESAIEIVGPCTCCADDRFFSFRAARGAATGRQASVIAWCP